ncbi:hypothetical protein EVAR_54625_1 [Eumeta japonica]|uniref:Integrin beta epidermal growth factor-like domain-containing protein n=1 Tax=Eumeta variegata TaxID=151549 RepID=A0A4C1X604_EUMVA|nr:hypothetical protein EVAR_54625_1 [Eumeta japonica]
MFSCVHGKTVAIDESWTCHTKLSCSDCLQLTHCQWCESEKSCLSPKISSDVCPDELIIYEDKNVDIALNAECACGGGKVEKESCVPTGADNTTICSGRGECVCGRCFCKTPDPEHPTKMITGEFCELDNYSCEGPSCREGPYYAPWNF